MHVVLAIVRFPNDLVFAGRLAGTSRSASRMQSLSILRALLQRLEYTAGQSFQHISSVDENFN